MCLKTFSMLSLSSLKGKNKQTAVLVRIWCVLYFPGTRTQRWKMVWVEIRENCWISSFTGQQKLATVPIKVIQCSLKPWVAEILMKLMTLWRKIPNLSVFGYTKCSTCHHYPTHRKSAGQFSECTAVISHKSSTLARSSRSYCHSGLQSSA